MLQGVRKQNRKFKFTKLVRDNIVEGIIKAGNTANWRTLSNEEYIDELKKKVIEEAQEIPSAHNKDLVNELADIQEIIDNILVALKVTKKEFENIQKKKNDKAGSFKNKQYIEDVEVKQDSEWVKYYLAAPDKYPEIK
ncbi:MAG: nucleoside triphosphate pyrophosphohydrolase [Patescibacteria group bacterium]